MASLVRTHNVKVGDTLKCDMNVPEIGLKKGEKRKVVEICDELFVRFEGFEHERYYVRIWSKA